MAIRYPNAYAMRYKNYDEKWLGSVYDSYEKVKEVAERLAKDDFDELASKSKFVKIEYGHVPAWALTREEYNKMYYDEEPIMTDAGELDYSDIVIKIEKGLILALVHDEYAFKLDKDWDTHVIDYDEAKFLATGVE